MKRRRNFAPSLMRGLFSVSPRWYDVLVGDLSYMWFAMWH